jgi:hypothetical protein
MSFLGHYDAMLDSIASNDDDDVRHIIPPDEEASESSSSLGMTIVSSAPSYEEEIVFEWPSSMQPSEHIPMSLSTHESMSLTMNSSWILTAENNHPHDIIIPCDNDENNDGDHDSELSYQPSSVPSSEDHHLWTSISSSSSSSSSHNDSSSDDWEHIHRVCHDDQGVYLQTSNTTLVNAPWSSWYQTLSSEDDWDELKSRVQEILHALDDLESYTAEELLALWIEQEEELFWNSKQPAADEGLSVRWGEAVAVAAAVASFGVLMLRRS